MKNGRTIAEDLDVSNDNHESWKRLEIGWCECFQGVPNNQHKVFIEHIQDRDDTTFSPWEEYLVTHVAVCTKSTLQALHNTMDFDLFPLCCIFSAILRFTTTPQ